MQQSTMKRKRKRGGGAGGPTRRGRRERAPALSPEVLRAALREATYLRRRKNVIGLSIGMRHRRDCGWIPHEACISIRVAEKLPPDELRARQAFPAFITVKCGGRSWRIPTDVRTAGGPAVGTCFGHVAARLTENGAGNVLGGVSACVITETDPKFLISGHVAARAGRTLLANGVQLVTEHPAMTSRLDHCLASAEFQLTDATLPDGVRFTGIRDSASIRRGEPLFVSRALDASTHQVTVRNTDADALFEYSTGIRRVFGLIATDQVCEKGDSGCPLFDADHKLVGTLLGGVGEDYYLPIDYAFDKLTIGLPS
jgi:hypothetical protein